MKLCLPVGSGLAAVVCGLIPSWAWANKQSAPPDPEILGFERDNLIFVSVACVVLLCFGAFAFVRGAQVRR
jgi:hypothetical protein